MPLSVSFGGVYYLPKYQVARPPLDENTAAAPSPQSPLFRMTPEVPFLPYLQAPYQGDSTILTWGDRVFLLRDDALGQDASTWRVNSHGMESLSEDELDTLKLAFLYANPAEKPIFTRTTVYPTTDPTSPPAFLFRPDAPGESWQMRPQEDTGLFDS
jgi:hypothetical protein